MMLKVLSTRIDKFGGDKYAEVNLNIEDIT
jgi:hypothetical protein